MWLSPLAQSQEPFWGQPFAGPERTSAVELPGVRSQPEEAWSRKFGEILAGPVNWASAIFVVVDDENGVELQLLNSATGETHDSVPVRAEGPYWLGVRDQTLIVVGADKILRYRVSQDEIGNAKVVRGEFRAMGLITDDFFFTRAQDREALIFDVDRMRELERTTFGESDFCYAQGQLLSVGSPITDRGALGSVRLYLAECRLNGRKLEFPERPLIGSKVITRSGAPVVDALIPVHFPNQDEDLSVLVRVPSGLGKSATGQFTWTSFPMTRAISELESQAAWHERGMFGLDSEGCVMVERPDHSDARLLEKDQLPEGAMHGSPSRAGDVLYLQNWAFDLRSDEALWVLEGAQPSHALVPLPERRFVARYMDHHLRCFGESEPLDAFASTEDIHADFLREAAARSTSRIGDGQGVILIQGTRIAGEFVRDHDAYVVLRGEQGEELVPRVLIAAMDHGDKIEVLDGGRALPQAWSRYANDQYVEVFEEAFGAFAKLRLSDECTRLITEARSRGVAEERLKEWMDRVGRLRPNTQDRPGFGKQAFSTEAEARGELLGHALALATLCVEAGYPIHAGAILANERKHAGDSEAWNALGLSVLDPSFLSTELGEDVDLWLDWCAELADIEASFVHADDEIRASWKNSRWEDALAIRSPRAVIVCELREVSLVGPAIRTIERSLRVLEEQFGKMKMSTSTSPVEVRLFKSKNALHLAQEDQKLKLKDWVVGYTGETDGVVRLCSTAEDPTRRSSELNALLCGLVTGAYLDRWWQPEGPKKNLDQVRGIWAARGLGHLLRIQASEIMHGQSKLDAFRNPEMDMLCQIARGRLPYRISSFFDASMEQFMAIDPGDTVGMRVRVSSEIFPDNAQRAFTRQSAGLVYFFLHGCKRAGKKELIAYLDHYGRGETAPEGWKFFGYESAEELDREFQSYLMSLDSRF